MAHRLTTRSADEMRSGEHTQEPAVLAEVRRGEVVESVHPGTVVVADAEGRVVAWAGQPSQTIYFRSSAKPVQAVPLVESGAADAFGFTEDELALACSSHDATPAHQRGVARMLAKLGLDEDALRCGVAPSADQEEAARITLGLKAPSQIQCECSGEHAGMLAACQHLGYPLDDYVAPDHPLQQQIRQLIARVLDVETRDLVEGTDGCRIPTFAAPVQAFAMAYARFATPDRVPATRCDGLETHLKRLRSAMAAHPTLVGGEQTLDSDLMGLSEGRIIAKLGAEGLLCVAVPERGLGLAITVEDGSPRGLGPAIIQVLDELELADGKMLQALRERHGGQVMTFAGESVGTVHPGFQLNREASVMGALGQ
jgi:L-asparaginase II